MIHQVDKKYKNKEIAETMMISYYQEYKEYNVS